MWRKSEGKERGPDRGKDATEGKTETIYAGIAVGSIDYWQEWSGTGARAEQSHDGDWLDKESRIW